MKHAVDRGAESRPARDHASIAERRESMLNILGSWALEDAIPDEEGLRVVRRYVEGELTLTEAIEEVKARFTPLHSDSDLGHR
ncbi:antitoxin VbhA family protein [Leucobacter sp. HY1910]